MCSTANLANQLLIGTVTEIMHRCTKMYGFNKFHCFLPHFQSCNEINSEMEVIFSFAHKDLCFLLIFLVWILSSHCCK